MRKIKKTPKPQVLIDHAKEWTTEYCACLNAGNKPSDTVANRYNHPEIKTALEKETHEKCAYCESKIKHISYGDIEHILPKNRDARPDLYVEWANLTLSCEQCNRSGKRTYYNPKLSLVNPYTDAPEDFLHDIGPLVMPKGRKDAIRAHAEKNGESLNGFINRAIDEAMERDDQADSDC